MQNTKISKTQSIYCNLYRILNHENITLEDGRIVINDEELANAIESEGFIINGDETQDGIKVGVTVEKI